MEGSTTSSTPSLKKMRKGTHSCLECRRRKIRCIWPPDSEACYSCAARKLPCSEQTYEAVPRPRFPRTKRMRERIGELQGTINQIAQRLNSLGLDAAEILRGLDLQSQPLSGSCNNPSSDSHRSANFSDLRISEDLSSHLDNPPLLALFDNELFCPEDGKFSVNPEMQTLDSFHGNTARRYSSLLRYLRTMVPSPEAVDIILQNSQLSICLLGKTFSEVQGFGSNRSEESRLEAIRDWMIRSFRSEDIGTLPKVLICLATCIQQLPAGILIEALEPQVPLEILHKSYMDCVEAFLSPDDGLVGSFEGVDCLLTQVKFYMNAGLPRKAWVIFRRAATFAQLLGTHHHCFSDEEPDMRKIGLWLQLSQIDKALSLLLGLPYMISDIPFRTEHNAHVSSALPPMMLFMLGLSEIAKKIIDRNSRGQANASIAETLELDEDLEQCQNIMPASWWSSLPDSSTALDTAYETCVVKFWYHSLRNHLHLPFILRSSASREYQHNTDKAMQSSREMIRIYFVLRDVHRPILRLCNAMDFQVLTAALIIILSLINNSLISQHEDWALIYGLTSTMNRTAQDIPDCVAAQAARLLEDLSKLRYNFADSDETFHVILPYFGEIRIRRKRREEHVRWTTSQFLEHGVSEGLQAPEQMNVGLGQELPQLREASHMQNLEEPLIDYSDYFSMNDPEAFLGVDQDWASIVDFSLQDEWDWYFENAGST